MISTNTLFTTNGVLTRKKAGFPDCLVTIKVRNNAGVLVKIHGKYSKLVQHFTNIYKLNNKYTNFIFLNSGMWRMQRTSSQLHTQLMQLRKERLKRFSYACLDSSQTTAIPVQHSNEVI